jgi:hypothetical protein
MPLIGRSVRAAQMHGNQFYIDSIDGCSWKKFGE